MMMVLNQVVDTFNPLTTDDAIWRCLILAACYQLAQSVLKIGFALAKKSRIGGGRWVLARGAVHMAAALAGCRKALVGTGWAISHHKQAQEPLLSPCSGTISGLVGSIQSGGACAGRKALTIESLLMSGCGWGYEPKEIVSKKL